MVFVVEKHSTGEFRYSLNDAMDLIGFGKYNTAMLISCCLLILSMYLDLFGLSVALPAAACDLGLTSSEQGILSAVLLIGVMISSYAWGLCADTRGRRWTLLVAMPVGCTLNVITSLAPNYASLATLKFLSAMFTSSANAAAFVLLGESTPLRHRSRCMFLMASATMFVQFVCSAFALPIFELTFRISVPWLNLELRPWRLLLLVNSIPGIIGTAGMLLLCESPKYLLTNNQNEKAIEIMKKMYLWNKGVKCIFPVSSIIPEETPVPSEGSKIRKIWNQTAPLFKPPFLKNSLIIYYLLLCGFMTSTGFSMWVPTMTNAYFSGEDVDGKTFCEVASTSASTSNSTTIDCDNAIQQSTLLAVMCYSGCSGTLAIIISFLVGIVGKRRMTILVFFISSICGIILLFAKIPLLSIALFYSFLYVVLILGNMNIYLVELNPTHLRGMATCLSVVVARGFGFFSVQLIATLLADHCVPMIGGYIALVISGLLVSLFLPSEKAKEVCDNTKIDQQSDKTNSNKTYLN